MDQVSWLGSHKEYMYVFQNEDQNINSPICLFVCSPYYFNNLFISKAFWLLIVVFFLFKLQE